MLVIRRRTNSKDEGVVPKKALKETSQEAVEMCMSEGNRHVSIPVARRGVWAVVKLRPHVFSVTHIPSGLGIGRPDDPKSMQWTKAESLALLGALCFRLGENFEGHLKFGEKPSQTAIDKGRAEISDWYTKYQDGL